MKVIIDCDPGIDDAVALLAACGHPAIEPVAVTTVAGNVPADIGTRNALQVLELAGRTDVPVAQGSASPLRGSLPKDPFSHGRDGLGGAHLPEPTASRDPRPAWQLIQDVAEDSDEELTLLALGPLTNVALALTKGRGLPDSVARIVAIAGLYNTSESGYRYATGVNPTSEWNVYVDPHAADQVFRSGRDLVLIGLDVAAGPVNSLDADELAQLDAAPGRVGEFVRGTVQFTASRGFANYCSFIDPLAVMYTVNPSRFRLETMHVAVETEGVLTRGQTVVESREYFQDPTFSSMSIVTAIDHSWAKRELIRSLGTERTMQNRSS